MELNLKYHKENLKIIELFRKPKLGNLISKSKNYNNKKSKFQTKENGYSIEFNFDVTSNTRRDLGLGEYRKGLKIQFKDKVYNLESVFQGNYSPPKITCSIDRLHTDGYSLTTKYYYQLLIPLEKRLQFNNKINCIKFSTDLGYSSMRGTVAEINNDSIELCFIKNNKNENFLAIDSRIKQTFEEFSQKAHAAKIGIGYLTGYCPGNQGYFFTSTKKNCKYYKHFRFVTLRDSIQSQYNPICSNAFAYLQNNLSLAKQYYSILRPVSLKEFSNLCTKLCNSLEFASSIMLILESSVASLLFMPGGYAIALETISDLVIGKNKLKLTPIKDKSVSKIIRKQFLDVLDKNSELLATSDIKTVKNRIVQFNQTTNGARLQAPFELLNIQLFDEDYKIFGTRNDFLHGRVPDLSKKGPSRSTERINKDLYYCSLKLYTLLNMLILKWIGYDNKVVNYPKLQEGYTQIKLEEEPFRQV